MEVGGCLTSQGGGGSYDGNHYWFEWRKLLDSGDRYDWMLEPGQIVGDGITFGIFRQRLGRQRKTITRAPRDIAPISKVS